MTRCVTDPRDRWLTLDEVSEVLAGISRTTIMRWVNRKADPLPATRFGGRILIRQSDLDEFGTRVGAR